MANQDVIILLSFERKLRKHFPHLKQSALGNSALYMIKIIINFQFKWGLELKFPILIHLCGGQHLNFATYLINFIILSNR